MWDHLLVESFSQTNRAAIRAEFGQSRGSFLIIPSAIFFLCHAYTSFGLYRKYYNICLKSKNIHFTKATTGVEEKAKFHSF
jgi:hypothetical protein